MKVSDAIFDILKQYVDTVFFVPGGHAAHLVDSLGRSGLKAVSALHEQGAGFMAIGYSQARNGLGVCLTTSGPGATNAITPCAAAWMDSVPVLFISGQANSTSLIGNSGLRTRGVQEVDIVSLVKPITKFAILFGDGLGAKADVGTMNIYCDYALQARPGPCWLDVPLDVQGMEI
jgi:acetolactate synthase-1/2/3 large subunit